MPYPSSLSLCQQISQRRVIQGAPWRRLAVLAGAAVPTCGWGPLSFLPGFSFASCDTLCCSCRSCCMFFSDWPWRSSTTGVLALFSCCQETTFLLEPYFPCLPCVFTGTSQHVNIWKVFLCCFSLLNIRCRLLFYLVFLTCLMNFLHPPSANF